MHCEVSNMLGMQSWVLIQEKQQQTKLEIGGNFLNLIKDSYKKRIAIIYKMSKKVRMFTLTTFIHHCIGRPN